MRLFTTIIAVILILSGCKKSEGCGDPNALNFDESKDIQKQALCSYSKVTFYAASETFTGVQIDSIQIEIDDQYIGTLHQFNQPYPSNCNQTGTIGYSLTSGNESVWFARYFLRNGGLVTRQTTFKANRSESCIKVDVTP